LPTESSGLFTGAGGDGKASAAPAISFTNRLKSSKPVEGMIMVQRFRDV
jgi:hypothetical protein